MIRADGLYHTGDLGEALPDGRICCSGRNGDVFESFDYWICPQELENVICVHPSVHDSTGIPIPHPIGDWRPKAYIEVAAGVTASAQQRPNSAYPFPQNHPPEGVF